MGNSQSSQKVNFEDIQFVLKNSESHILINTLDINDQICLLPNTINASQEEIIINKLIKSGNKDIKIIVYGRNCNDEKIYKKQSQLSSLGFYNVFIYTGGMFEWMLLQDIYGVNDFPTSKKELDILKFKPVKTLNVSLLEY
jgi:rhodanese-related sulfurtransferase